MPVIPPPRMRPVSLALIAATLAAALAAPASVLGADPKKKPEEDRGKLLYERHCAACHGVRAGGDGPATQALVVPVPDLQGKVKADKPTIDLVLMGRGPMPAFEPSFGNDDAKRVLTFMSKLTTAAPPEGDAAEPEPEPEPPTEGGDGPGPAGAEPPQEDAPEAP